MIDAPELKEFKLATDTMVNVESMIMRSKIIYNSVIVEYRSPTIDINCNGGNCSGKLKVFQL